MSDILARIAEYKRREVEARKQTRPLKDVTRAAHAASPTRGFHNALVQASAAHGVGLIAEIKKASPSKGLIRADFNPADLAHAYAKGGAHCLSILTDTPSFQGADEHLVEARAKVALPVLRKDFMLDTYQVAEARALGADCILVILAMVEDATAVNLVEEATSYGMDVLLEVHDESELERALTLKSPLIGINNRDLKSFVTDLGICERLSPLVPADRLCVAESGIFTPDDVARVKAAGAKAILVGESLMRASDVTQATRSLLA